MQHECILPKTQQEITLVHRIIEKCIDLDYSRKI